MKVGPNETTGRCQGHWFTGQGHKDQISYLLSRQYFLMTLIEVMT